MSALARAHCEPFLRRVHRLLEAGYQRLNPTDLSLLDEPVITHELKIKMKAVTQEERWARFLVVTLEAPVDHLPHRRGKESPKVDLTVEEPREALGPNPEYHWEAKILGKGKGTDLYLGPDGLGCIIAGTYAPGASDAGMLGYVKQGKRPTDWARLIQAGLLKHGGSLGRTDEVWALEPAIAESLPCYRSHHTRTSGPIAIHHVLLRCSPDPPAPSPVAATSGGGSSAPG